jgi:hypothetical protein
LICDTSAYSADAGHYEQARCEYSVDFPAAPEINSIYTPGVGEIPSVQYFGKDYFLKFECLPRNPIAVSKIQAYEMADNYAVANGIENHTVEYSEEEVGTVVSIKGYKNIDGENAIFRVLMVFGNNSVASLYATGLAKGYPQRGVMEYLDSVSR